MDSTLRQKYYIRRNRSEDYNDVAHLFDGVRILKVTGMMSKGEPVNIYNEQWNDSQVDDYLVTTIDANGNPKVITKNTDIKILFIVSRKYAVNDIDVAVQHDEFINYMTGSEIWIKSFYTEKVAHCICLQGYEPQTIRLKREASRSYIIGELTLHQLQLATSFSSGHGGSDDDTPDPPIPPEPEPPTPTYKLYIGIGNETLTPQDGIANLENLQEYSLDDVSGDYTLIVPSTNYLWICTDDTVEQVLASGLEVPMNAPITVSGLNCYRSITKILPHTMFFTISSQI